MFAFAVTRSPFYGYGIRMNKNLIFAAAAVIGIAVAGFFINQYFVLQKAHSSFENYYAFRGCSELVEKTDTYGTCRLPSGDIIKLVLINGKWYLEGDGPGVW